MSKQDTTINRTEMQNKILDLERDYFKILEDVLFSDDFKNDLLTIEKEIRENYPKFKKTWKIKNKIKVPAERVVRHHIYTKLNKEIVGIYPSPISSDIGIMLRDCVLCIDVKTVDTHGNKLDVNPVIVESNQISFDNSRHPYVTTASNLESIDHYTRRPVLTYVFKIVYTDDNYSFQLSRKEFPTITLTCIPNGELSNLFGNDIINNFKTYDYYTEKERPGLDAYPIPEEMNTAKLRQEFTEYYCMEENKFNRISINTGKKTTPAYYDASNKVIWRCTSNNNKHVIRAVKCGATSRLDNEALKFRYDSENNKWTGLKEKTILEIRD